MGLVLVLGSIVALTVVHPRNFEDQAHPRYQPGVVATHDVIADHGFSLVRDDIAMESARRDARRQSPVVLRHRESVQIAQGAILEGFYSDLDSGGAELAERWSFGLSDEDLALFTGRTSEGRHLRRLAAGLLERLFEQGVVGGDVARIDRPLVVRRDGRERAVDSHALVSKADLALVLQDRLQEMTDGRDEQRVVAGLVRALAEPNLIYDVDESELRARHAEGAVPSVIAQVRAGERVVAAHEIVSELQAAKLEAYQASSDGRERRSGPWPRARLLTAHATMLGLSILAFGLYLSRYRPEMWSHPRRFLMPFAIFIVVAATCIPILATGGLDDLLAPVTLAAVLGVILMDVHAAVMISVLSACAMALYSASPAASTLPEILTSIGVVFFLTNIRKRALFYRTTLVTAALGAVVVLGVDQTLGFAIDRTLVRVASQVGSVLASFLLALFMLPAFERVFGVTTDLSLAEYTDLNHPLLRRLATEAPGSFHHSIMMANLAEAAAIAIGANPLLARAGAYFHDIGKMLKAGYFIENQIGVPNKHDQLTPPMSALVIQSHVKEGIELARRNRLPQAIIDFIPEHHGTSVISYFYNKAVESDERGPVRMDDYRYPGPKPQSRETAIVMIADTVEASSRTLGDPSPARLEQLIKKSVNDKFANGQLENSKLTLADLRQIGDAFLPILIGAFHQRVEYAETAEHHFQKKEKDRIHRDRKVRVAEHEALSKSRSGGRVSSGGGGS